MINLYVCLSAIAITADQLQVIEWRTWMEWAGQGNWQDFVDGLDTEQSDDEDIDDGALDRLTALGKVFPKHWKWKSQHWKIARSATFLIAASES